MYAWTFELGLWIHLGNLGLNVFVRSEASLIWFGLIWLGFKLFGRTCSCLIVVWLKF